mmetsp:Transcript_1108/g.1528  ORF Transcript_1108/g.1528 Transcript_1108/m.1528 type:complete len:401 (+) Transcript_1108:60-1262(+)
MTDSTPVKSTNLLLVLCYLTIPGLWGASQVILIPYVVHLLVLVTAILYIACHWSLVLREEPTVDEDGNSTSASSAGETLRKEDAMQFPIMGSLSLFSLYLAFRFLDKEMVNLIIGGYFALVGTMALTATIAPALSFLIPLNILKKKFHYGTQINHSLPAFLAGESPWEIEIEFSTAEALAFIKSVVFCYFYVTTKSWPLNNILGICFCIQGIERFSLGTYKIGAILLVGLFFYDIFWVFGTDVMVTVAKNLDGPIKILFPRSLTPNPETGKIDLSLLGLGDIVIPGFFLALLLRFDAHKSNVSTIAPTNVHASFPKPYFHSCLIAYILGLGTTLYVMIAFNAAQPALLYLVPACLGSSLLCAVVRGELKELFDYSEEEEEEEEEEEQKTVKKDEAAKKDD